MTVILLGSGYILAQNDQAHSDAGQPVAKKAQTTCPVMGGAINTNLYVDANGKRVYFCCNGCPTEFKKAPAKYIATLEKDGVKLDKAPAADSTKKQTTAAEAAPAQCHDHSAMKGGGCCK